MNQFRRLLITLAVSSSVALSSIVIPRLGDFAIPTKAALDQNWTRVTRPQIHRSLPDGEKAELQHRASSNVTPTNHITAQVLGVSKPLYALHRTADQSFLTVVDRLLEI